MPCNNALDLYLKSPNRDRLKFCLLEVNHAGYRIGPKDWDALSRIWIDLFRQPTYLRLDGEPLLIFFDPQGLQNAFGGVEGVRKAFESLRAKAKQAGLPGVAIAACSESGVSLTDLARSGYTLLTGYAYSGGYHERRQPKAVPRTDRSAAAGSSISSPNTRRCRTSR